MGVGLDHRGMVIDMIEAKLTTLEQIKAFLKRTEAVEFSGSGEGGDCYRPYRRCAATIPLWATGTGRRRHLMPMSMGKLSLA